MPDPIDITVPAAAKPLPPIDPNVQIPESVRRAAAKAEAYYAPQPPVADPPVAPEPQADPAAPLQPPPPEPPVDPAVAPEPPKPRKPRAAQRVAAPAPAEPPPPAPPPADPDVPEAQWEHRFRSMKGRYDANQGVMAQMQEQMSLMAQELARTQALLTNPVNQPPPPSSLITDLDRQNYGTDLIDLTTRVAREAVEPELNAVKQDNQRLQKRVLQQSQQGVIEHLDAEIPNWREIRASERFQRWLSLPDIYSGVVRKQTIDAAYAAASAPRVLAFFRGFLAEEVATGNIDPPVASQQPTPAPRTAAVPLDTIAAPGRARPASGGNTPAPAEDKPTFTRAMITAFYNDIRAGRWAGRDQDRAAYEQAIFAAQREGRIR